jgi:NAD-dependent SIR2 family protein deacetylase
LYRALGTVQPLVAQLADMVYTAGNVVALTGAGLSTESGIPDYRSPNGSYSKGHSPITQQQFLGSAVHRQRYWARSFAAWDVFSSARPNAAHRALATMESRGLVNHVITQNVDGLHSQAGSVYVTELHGSTASVVCLDCQRTVARREYQARLHEANSEWLRAHFGESRDFARLRADGDIDIDCDFSAFKVPRCEGCGSVHSAATPAAAHGSSGDDGGGGGGGGGGLNSAGHITVHARAEPPAGGGRGEPPAAPRRGGSLAGSGGGGSPAAVPLMKPDVVFFGDNVPPQRVQDAFDQVVGQRAYVGASRAAVAASRPP